MKDIEIPSDCTTCGACCWHPTDRKWVEVTTEDAAHLPPDSLVVGDLEPFAMACDADGRCHQLLGEIGVSVRCCVYPIRPTVCRKVQPGSEVCQLSIWRWYRAKERAAEGGR